MASRKSALGPKGLAAWVTAVELALGAVLKVSRSFLFVPDGCMAFSNCHAGRSCFLGLVLLVLEGFPGLQTA